MNFPATLKDPWQFGKVFHTVALSNHYFGEQNTTFYFIEFLSIVYKKILDLFILWISTLPACIFVYHVYSWSY